MANLQTEFHHDQVEGRSYDLVPDCEAIAHVTSSEVVTPKSGQGLMLKLRWDLLDGPHTGRVIFEQLNYQHTNPTAQLIGQQRLKELCEAMAVATPLTDSEDLHFKPVLVSVRTEKGKDGYDDKNIVKRVKPAQAAAPGTPGAKPTAPRQQPAAGTPRGAPQTAAKTPERAWGNRGA